MPSASARNPAWHRSTQKNNACTMTNTFSSIKGALLRRNGGLGLGPVELPRPVRSRRGNRRDSTERTTTTTTSAPASAVAQVDARRRVSLHASIDLASVDESAALDSALDSALATALDSRDVPQHGDILVQARIRLEDVPSPPREIDLSELSSEDLERLRVEDPFLYYSIPAVRARRGTEASASSSGGSSADPAAAAASRVAFEDGVADAVPGRQRRRRGSRLRASCPASILSDADLAREGVVSKRRRLSVEPHPWFCEDDDLPEGEGGGDDAEGGADDEDKVLRGPRGILGMEAGEGTDDDDDEDWDKIFEEIG
ncbi:hypothetical protein ACHAWF_016092 [Thalassiosira exigua]